MGLHRGRRQQVSQTTRRGEVGTRAVKMGMTVALCGLLSGLGPTGMPISGLPNLLASVQADSSSDMGNKLVSLDIAAADLHEVVHMLQLQTHANIVVQDGDAPYHKVNVSLDHMPLAKVLHNIALSANATITRDSDGVYIFQPTQFASTDASDSPVVQPQQPAQRSRPGNLHNYKLVLAHARPRDIVAFMEYEGNFGEYVATNQLSGHEMDTTMTQNAPITQLSSPGGDQSPSVPIGRGNTGASAANYSAEAHRTADDNSGSQAHQFPGGGFGGGGFGGGGFGGNGVNGNGVNGQGATGGLPDGVQKIYAMEADNSLLILSTPEGFQALKEIVKNLDIQPRQVEIKVEFVTVRVSDLETYGVNFTLVPAPGVTTSTNIGGSTSGTFALQYAAGNVALTLAANLQKSHSKIVQAPMITTTNNYAANVIVTDEIPFTTTSTVIPGGSGTAVSQTTQQFLRVQTGLEVAPRINADDTITLELNPQISTPTKNPSGPPTVTTQSVKTLRTVHNGETMVLGGLITKFDTRAQDRIPIISQLPIIGNLFRNKDVTLQESELLIFVTPTILGEEIQAGSNGNVTP